MVVVVAGCGVSGRSQERENPHRQDSIIQMVPWTKLLSKIPQGHGLRRKRVLYCNGQS